MLTACPAARVLGVGSPEPAVHMLMSLAPTSATPRLDWIIVLGFACAAFVTLAIVFVRGKRANPENWRTKRARHGMVLLAAWICIIIARIILAHRGHLPYPLSRGKVASSG